MRIVEITRYESFVSFVVEGDCGQVHVQYRAEKVWRDDEGTWQIAEGAQPFHFAVLTAATQADARLSPALLRALKKATTEPL